MPRPNPILGVHVVPGAVAWARVRSEPDGAFRVVAWGTERTAGETVASLAAAAEVLGRRAFRGRGAFVALPDVSGCLVTAVIPSDELHLEGDDLHRELYESTPFEPDAASLRHRLVRTEGRRREFLAAALPAAQERQALEALGRRADAAVGLGFATVCTVRGARALGLAPPEGFLVEAGARATAVVALDGPRTRRYLLAAGRDDAGPDAAALAADVLSVVAYHRAQPGAPKRPDADAVAPVIVGTGVALSDPALRGALAGTLGDAFRAVEPRYEPECRVAWDDAPGPALPALAGAVGAALEAFAAPADRLALREPPADLPEVPDRSPWLVAAGVAAGLAIVAAGASFWWPPADRDAPVAAPEGRRAAPSDPSSDTAWRAAHAASWRVALASVARVLDDGGRGDRAARRVVVSATGEGWAVLTEVRVRGGAGARAAARTEMTGRLAAARGVPPHAPVVFEPDGSEDVEEDEPSGVLRLRWRVRATTSLSGATADRAVAEALAELPRTGLGNGVASPVVVDAADALLCAARLAGDAPPARTEIAAVAGGRARVEVTEPATRPAFALDEDVSPGDVAAALRAPLPAVRFVADDDVDPGLGLTARAAAPGKVRLEALPAWRPRRLERRGPGAHAAWTEVAAFGGEAIESDDEVPGAGGAWSWRLLAQGGQVPSATTVDVEVPVAVELLGRAPGAAARFALVRTWAGAARRAVAELRPGDAVRATTAASAGVPALEFDAGEALVDFGQEETFDSCRAALPEYLPDGRVRRGEDGAPALVERSIRRPVRVLSARLRRADGAVRVVSRKMTDG